MEDKKALSILFDAHWSSSGWKRKEEVSEEDFKYAFSKGYMFEKMEITHDDLIVKLKKLTESIELVDVVHAFLYSLSTRKLEYRSALGSYMFAASLPLHQFEDLKFQEDFCGICCKLRSEVINKNALNFERYKWGGVRHLDPCFVLFDLEQFSKLPKVIPSSEDYLIFKKIIQTAQDLAPDSKVRDLEKSLSKIIKSNKSEREILIQILSYSSLIENPEYPGFYTRYTNFCDRKSSGQHNNDWEYPSFLWKASDGVNEKALKRLIPDYE